MIDEVDGMEEDGALSVGLELSLKMIQNDFYCTHVE